MEMAMDNVGMITKKLFTSLIAGKPIDFGKVRFDTNDEHALREALMRYGYIKPWDQEWFNITGVTINCKRSIFKIHKPFRYVAIHGNAPPVPVACEPGNVISLLKENEHS